MTYNVLSGTLSLNTTTTCISGGYSRLCRVIMFVIKLCLLVWQLMEAYDEQLQQLMNDNNISCC